MEDIYNKALELLDALGYELQESGGDTFLINFASSKAHEHIKAFCNIGELNDALILIGAEMAFADFLRFKLATGSLSLEGLDLTGAVTEITEGDTAVTFAGAAEGTSQAELFSDLLERLLNRDNELAKWRRFRW